MFRELFLLFHAHIALLAQQTPLGKDSPNSSTVISVICNNNEHFMRQISFYEPPSVYNENGNLRVEMKSK